MGILSGCCWWLWEVLVEGYHFVCDCDQYIYIYKRYLWVFSSCDLSVQPKYKLCVKVSTCGLGSECQMPLFIWLCMCVLASQHDGIFVYMCKSIQLPEYVDILSLVKMQLTWRQFVCPPGNSKLFNLCVFFLCCSQLREMGWLGNMRAKQCGMFLGPSLRSCVVYSNV